MSANVAIALFGILVGLIVGLVGAVYALMRAEIARVAKNVHEVRNVVQANAAAIAVLEERSPGANPHR